MPTQYNGKPGNLIPNLPGLINISAIANTSPILITSSVAHKLSTGDYVTVIGCNLVPTANGTWQVSVVNGTQFTLKGSTAGGTAGLPDGQFQSLGLGPTFQIPSDGDSRNSASVNTGLEANGDRSTFLSKQLGGYRTVLKTRDVQNTGGPWFNHTYAAINTFELLSKFIPFPGLGIIPVQANDVVECRLTTELCDYNGQNIVALFASNIAPGAADNYLEIPGSRYDLPQNLTPTTSFQSGFTVCTSQVCSVTGYIFFALYGKTATAGAVTISSIFQYNISVDVHRPNDFLNRL